MDPWLESPRLWLGVHNCLITYAAEALQPVLQPRFVAAVEERVYVSTTGRNIVPDVSLRSSRGGLASRAPALLEPDEALVLELTEDEVHEAYIQILDLESQQEVVTIIEVLSPSNKIKGEGQDLYLSKQQEVLHSAASLVEIDLLRGGPHVLAVPEAEVMSLGDYDYLVAISRSWDREKRSLVYGRTVRQRLPRIAIPLQSADLPATLDLQSLIERVYEAGVYANRLDYSKPCIPRLRPDDERWAEERIAQWRSDEQ